MAIRLYDPSNTYGTCTDCGAIAVHKEFHQCPPQWRVWMEDGDRNYAPTIHARDAQDAAEKYCDQHDCDHDYTIIQSGSGRVVVERDGVTVTFDIEAESRPHYYATVADD